MKNILLNLSNQSDLDFIGQLAGDLLAAANVLHIPIFMAGAMARDLILFHGYGINTGRKTGDVDWAIMVKNWAQFDVLKARLIASKKFAASKHPHRLKYGTSLFVDLIPFGGIANAAGIIFWPPEHATQMTVLGFDEAYRNSVAVRLPANVDIQVTSLPSLALLKLFAWNERHLTSPRKDAHDFALIAQHYIDAGNRERLHSEFSFLLGDVDFDYESASAWMLGHDIAQTFSDLSIRRATEILVSEVNTQGQLILASAMPLAAKEAILLLENVKSGLMHFTQYR